MISNRIFILAVAFVSCASAVPPKTPKPSDYRQIIAKDPFGPLKSITVRTQNKRVEPVKKVDYDLKGISMTSSGWLVVVVDKRSPKRSIILHEKQKNLDDIKIQSVNQAVEPSKSTVTLLVNNRPQTVRFNMASIAKSRTSKSKTKTTVKKNQPRRGR